MIVGGLAKAEFTPPAGLSHLHLLFTFIMALNSRSGSDECVEDREKKVKTKRTAAGIPTWSPTVVLICRSTAYVWQSGRDAQFSADCGRTYQKPLRKGI